MKKLLLPTLLILSVVFMHCKEPELKPNSDYKLYPITLRAEKLANGDIKYNWNAINTAGFKSYVILRNNIDTVPYFSNAEDLVSRDISISLVTNINDPTVTEFIDTSSILPLKTFARIFAVVDDRILSSTNVAVQGRENIIQLKTRAEDVGFSAKYKQLVLPDNSKNLITFYNLQTNSLQSTLKGNGFLSAGEISYVETNLGDFFFIPTNFGSFMVVNAGNITDFTNVFLQTNGSVILHANNSFIVNSSAFSLNSFPTTIKNNGVPGAITSVFLPFEQDFNGNTFLRRFNNGKKFNAIKSNIKSVRISSYNFLEDGRFSNTPNFIFIHNLIPNSTFNKVSPYCNTIDDAYFIIDNNGTVYANSNSGNRLVLAEEVPTSSNTPIRYSNFLVNNSNGDIYAMRNSNNGRVNRKIDVFSYPDFKFKKSIDYLSPASRIFLLGNQLVLVTLSSSENPNLIIEYINL